MCVTIYFFTMAKKRGLIDKKMITLQTNPEIFMQEFFFLFVLAVSSSKPLRLIRSVGEPLNLVLDHSGALIEKAHCAQISR